MVSVDVKRHLMKKEKKKKKKKKKEGGRSFKSCVKVEVDILGSPSVTVLTVSVDVKQH